MTYQRLEELINVAQSETAASDVLRLGLREALRAVLELRKRLYEYELPIDESNVRRHNIRDDRDSIISDLKVSLKEAIAEIEIWKGHYKHICAQLNDMSSELAKARNKSI